LKTIKIRYETSDAQKREETGTLKDAPPTDENPNNKVLDIVGSYEFTTPEGNENSHALCVTHLSLYNNITHQHK
jgi:hypothetical protein